MKRTPQISLDEAAAMVRPGDVLMVGGFGMTGNPVHLLHALAKTGTDGLTYIANNVGEENLGGGRLLRNGQIRKAIGSYLTSNREAVAAAAAGEIEVELMPQGSFAEAIRAGGAGIGGFFTPTAAGTALGEGRETRTFQGVEQVFVPGLRADVAFIRAWKADRAGNLVYRMTEQNFNRAMATAADLVIAEVEEIVDVGALRPEDVHTPGCYVDYLVQASLRPEDLGSSVDVASSSRKPDAVRLAMASRAFAELRPGDIVNLGVGIPTLVADLIQPGDGIAIHTENGMLGMGPPPESGGAMEHPVNAGKSPVIALPGCSYFDSAESFAMIRGGHVDVAIMGGLQVDVHGNLANWSLPGQPVLGVGGAMDLARGAGRLLITMTHTDREGRSKIVPECTLPLTAERAVDLVITDLAVFAVTPGGLELREVMPGATLEDVRKRTAAPFRLAGTLATGS